MDNNLTTIIQKKLNKLIYHTKQNKVNKTFRTFNIIVGATGFEPIMTEPKPVVLPLHHTPM